jgi:hypothetical protein
MVQSGPPITIGSNNRSILFVRLMIGFVRRVIQSERPWIGSDYNSIGSERRSIGSEHRPPSLNILRSGTTTAPSGLNVLSSGPNIAPSEAPDATSGLYDPFAQFYSGSDTRTGIGLLDNDPLPSCPTAFLPQQ